MASPTVQNPIEIKVEHHAAEIEQQRVGIAGRKGLRFLRHVTPGCSIPIRLDVQKREG
jgi:hypothetical protein